MPASRMHLLVGIDTEGDNQWDAAARANQTFENIYALPRLHALFARHGVRPTYVITHPVATDARSAEVLRGTARAAATARSARTITRGKRRRARRRTSRRHPYASTLPRDQFEAQLASLTAAITAAVGVRPVSYRSGRFGFSADHVAALERHGLSRRVERRAAVLRDAQGRTGVRRGAAAAVLPRLRQRHAARHEQRARGAGFGGAEPPAAEGRCSTPTRGRRGRTRPSACCGRWASSRMRWLRPSYSSLEDMIGARAGPRAQRTSRC